MSAGQIKGSVTVPYTFQGEGSPLPRAAAARKAAVVQTDEDDLWAKQPVTYTPPAPIHLPQSLYPLSESSNRLSAARRTPTSRRLRNRLLVSVRRLRVERS